MIRSAIADGQVTLFRRECLNTSLESFVCCWLLQDQST